MPGLLGTAFAHTIDSVGEYRLEIGWMNEPVVSGETNGIEFSVNRLEPGLELKEQKFKEGISGLEKSLKIELLFKEEKIKLSLSPDHNIPGKYYAFVNPTVSGFYQVNILGHIEETPISLSMHPPKVDERSYIEFPKPSDLTLTQLIDGHTTLVGEINYLKNSVAKLEQSNQQINISYISIVVSILGISIALFTFFKIKRK
ncbi:MAG: hypothetical protein COV65_02320 [Nitrosopumilales archaeon CG11_big_fil_rev_8_21_14_0_20_33_24]|nr:MAG: hypothetical protein COV65_02320 [Nitrosopumilales archaeon CG11_big_fil_rev_8_21_14_0_20_33_24]PIY88891.1 MAG: hypothetical protein COY74_07255 [Nitrosopumilales archaeon CG_4_10_14_0_8_um_filter_34_8]PJB98267.1 MAG: hypothetical protein CO079_02990 [Nitrosopumilales archaeon CG_4_9_14_0_8_um_filter_34_10]